MPGNRNLKILHVIDSFDNGGPDMTLYRLLSSTDQNGFEQRVACLFHAGMVGKWTEDLGVPVYVVGTASVRSSLRAIWRLVRLIRSFRPQIIQGWTYYGNLAATVASVLTPGSWTVLWNIHHTVYDLKHEKQHTAAAIRLGAFLSGSPARIIYCAEAAATYNEALGFTPDRGVVITNGFDLARFAPSAGHRASVRAELGISEDALVVGLVARFHPMKDHSNFLNAAAITASKRSDVHFLMAGMGVDAANESITRFVGANGLSNRVHLLGQRQDVHRLMAALDVACCSSWSEAFPNIIGEAMACGVPCVSTDVGDVPWMIGQTGRVVRPRDAEALAAACESILELDADARRRLGGMARDRVKELFPLAKMVDAYEQLYETVAEP